jgi:hypothetical protein
MSLYNELADRAIVKRTMIEQTDRVVVDNFNVSTNNDEENGYRTKVTKQRTKWVVAYQVLRHNI